LKVKLTVSIDEAKKRVTKQLERGKTISKFPITSVQDLETVESRRSEWYEQTKNLLEEIDENSTLVKDFHYLTPSAQSGTRTLQDRVDDFRFDMKKDVKNLQSISDRLELIADLKPKSKRRKDKKRGLTPGEKTWVWENKSHRCYICHKMVKRFSEAHFDHTKAHTKKGKTTPANSGITHILCNQLKGKKSLREIQRHLGTEPKKKRIIKKSKRKKKKISKNFQNPI